MAIEMTTTIDADRALAMLNRTERVLADPERLIDAAGDAIRTHAERVFDSRGAATGTPWRPQSPATVRRHGASPILERTGGLRRSYTQEGAGNHRSIIGGSTGRFGSTHPLARLHHRRRPVLAWPTDADRNRELAVAIAGEVGRAIRGES